MTTYIVTRKADGAEVYRYSADAPIEWTGMGFADHDHTEYVEPVAVTPVAQVDPAAWRVVVGAFFDRFGQYKLPILASADPLVQALIKDCSVRKYIDLHGRRAELEQALGMLVAKGYAVDVTAVLDVQPTTDEVYSG